MDICRQYYDRMLTCVEYIKLSTIILIILLYNSKTISEKALWEHTTPLVFNNNKNK